MFSMYPHCWSCRWSRSNQSFCSRKRANSKLKQGDTILICCFSTHRDMIKLKLECSVWTLTSSRASHHLTMKGWACMCKAYGTRIDKVITSLTCCYNHNGVALEIAMEGCPRQRESGFTWHHSVFSCPCSLGWKVLFSEGRSWIVWASAQFFKVLKKKALGKILFPYWHDDWFLIHTNNIQGEEQEGRFTWLFKKCCFQRSKASLLS